ncbi:hypothetical protein [Actinomadura harenae]|uniref:Uncharacterized protein n=1 Tax=Actinomadura harenae TaxID=2483351 RepID=A0A3M2MDM9_9ACTN|nr:hypothetical protein [Actinomadura harenae]RMI45318.1 hypothetical protein EBO15_10350 [Actinomadura harenae]
MKHNGRPPISVSALPLNHVNLRRPDGERPDGERTMIVCPDCGTWVSLKRHLVLPHRISRYTDKQIRNFALGRRPAPAARRQERCPGSAQRVITDLAYETWRARLAEGIADASTRRSARTMVKPTPALAPSLTQMAAARRDRERATRPSRARALVTAGTPTNAV